MDRALINQLAASDSSPSSHNIVLKASVTARISIITTTLKYRTKLKFLYFSSGLKNNK